MDKFSLFLVAQATVMLAFGIIWGLVGAILAMTDNGVDDAYADKKKLTIMAVVFVIVAFAITMWVHLTVNTICWAVLFIITTPAAMWTSYRLWPSEECQSRRKKVVYVIFDIITIVLIVAIEATIARFSIRIRGKSSIQDYKKGL